MPFFFRVLAAGLVLACAATGCSTPRQRAREHAVAFHRLSPADQTLVLRGRVRPGLSQEGVYIAWGEPDQKTGGTGGKDATNNEIWVYRQRVTITEPQNSYDYYGPYQGYGHLAAPSLRPGYGVGGIGCEALLQFQPHVRSLDTLRLAEFSDGKIERFKTAEGTWSSPPSGVRAAGGFIQPASSNPLHGTDRPRLATTRAPFEANAGWRHSQRTLHTRLAVAPTSRLLAKHASHEMKSRRRFDGATHRVAKHIAPRFVARPTSGRVPSRGSGHHRSSRA